MEETSACHFIQNRFHHPVTFLSLQVQVLKVSACRHDTQLRPACVPGVVPVASNLPICLLNEFFPGTSFGLFAQNVWRNALLNFVKSCSRLR